MNGQKPNGLDPEKRIHVTMKMSEEALAPVDVETSVLDLLNGPTTFMPFHSDDRAVHLLNKFEILQVGPRDQNNRSLARELISVKEGHLETYNVSRADG